MFSLHETTRTRLCRAAFLLMCIGPTCAVLAWCVFVNTPHFRRSHERAIAARLGWQAKLKCASTPRPGLLLYEWLELADPETGQLVARLPFVEIQTNASVVVVRLPHPATITGARLDALVELVADLAARSTDSRPLRFEAQHLTLHFDSGDQSFTDVFGKVGGADAPAQARLAFRRATSGTSEPEPCLLTLGRSREEPVAPTIQLTTGTSGVPAALLAPFWPAAARFGKTCEFAGRIAATRESGVWTTRLEGRLSDVDLDLAVSRRFPHKLTGLADAEFESLTLADGRIETAKGRLTAGPGVISRSLVQAAETHLRIRATDRAIAGPANVIPYERLSAGFEIGADGLAVRGMVPQTQGAILVDQRNVLAVEPPLVCQPVLALVRTLVPQSDVQVPATRETAGLTNSLPVPSIALRPGSEEPLPNARPLTVNPLRSGPTFQR